MDYIEKIKKVNLMFPMEDTLILQFVMRKDYMRPMKHYKMLELFVVITKQF